MIDIEGSSSLFEFSCASRLSVGFSPSFKVTSAGTSSLFTSGGLGVVDLLDPSSSPITSSGSNSEGSGLFWGGPPSCLSRDLACEVCLFVDRARG